MSIKLVNMFDLIYCLTNTGDMINKEVTDHHRQVAYLGYRIAESMGLGQDEQREILLAGLLHDVGAFALEERIKIIDNEDFKGVHNHAFVGAALFENFAPLENVARIIRFHHVPWENGKGKEFRGKEVPMASQIIHLADRIAVLVDRENETIGQIRAVTDRIRTGEGDLFMPEAMAAFLDISAHEYVWLDIVYEPLMTLMPKMVNFDTLALTMDDTIHLSQVFARIIDFRSPFTATHSSGVAAIAVQLAELAGFSELECKMMEIAGYLHDLGKLAVSNKILEKAGPLDKEEFNAIRSHTFFTYRTLQAIESFDTINEWAAYHHERMDGRGYPFHLKGDEITLGSRIMAVADVFTAVTEDRPYRPGMDDGKAIRVIRGMVKTGGLCAYVSDLLLDHFENLNRLREEVQARAAQEYKAIREINNQS